ncbi:MULTISPECIES: chymotrypsin family serine protease [Mycobacterium avium complex (MAC)]|jgi:hypothetical protein|uniref:Serine protease n=1 Tax=Mycobacterium avium subsp. hominissuis TaxID=439334 RepID=A0A187NBC8_MYCAV|nr:hypothetical protein [Mycobacterium avium]ETA89974.1 hypothetical protein O984_24700 [Mycobacterium avium 05-4293]ETB17684.1 hypothetical protein O983_26505 [Mycobacterium avium 09-5983]ETB38396.1 hypothetical protein O974_27480 [Mycobacterium avium 11-0986]AKT73025.1 hypothetical protein MASH_00022 [Mycobacterium avium subsp. hominissuis]ETZ41178.1 hypothetical protein L837_5133 [Mycobacterium avium MAV_061107_1842]
MSTTTRRFTAIVAGLFTSAAMALAGAPGSHAALTVVSPGEEVDYINPGGHNQFCTIGYVYTGADLHTYAITAGHCRSDPTAGYVRDKRNGLTGDFVRTVFAPPRSGGADYALIDFTTNSLASVFIEGNHTLFTEDHPEPQLGQTVCRLGVSSGQHCGQIAASHGEDQYLTTGMPPSIPGDSGGPVWTPTAQGNARIIGIWLGEKTTAAGQEYGRFASLSRGLRALNAPAGLDQNSSSPE